MTKLIFLFIFAWLAGSVNFSILVFKLTGRDDPRGRGSKNPGATNVYRQAGLKWAAAVLLLDMVRAMAVAALAVIWLLPAQIPWVGLGLILGNRFPCFHGFRGGKGVANYLGFCLLLVPVWAGIGAICWGIVFLIWRIPFVASFSLVLCLSTGMILRPEAGAWGIIGTVVTTVFIISWHHQNMSTHWGKALGCRRERP
ncbi:glycerol-3-phosphate acyltransferase [Desulfosarcina sp. OttesenSCG-928-G10]|nr:glycerol-3-phosphate acyltransferase [Desulfosarcina sp. OttesenSCG-928-G10]MDL2321104.1 glycerol-3-phosphate acyltransferase [Desulfosarcina sp. OttesenSCG-928-B08]